jgi:FkbM family methyltransferase
MKGPAAALAALLRSTGPFRGKWRLVRAWTRLVDAKAPRVRVLPGGGEVLCDLSIPYEAVVWLGKEEQQELEILHRLLRPGDVFVDCGANVGIWTLTAASAVGPGGRVHAFEPNPATVRKLTGNLFRSGFGNVDIVPAAVGRTKGELLLRCEAEHNLSRIVAESDAGTVPVRVVPLDQALGTERIAGCKIDVEGAELDVLAGAERILATSRPWLCVELNPDYSGDGTLGHWEVHRYLRSLGYSARRFEDALTPSPDRNLPDRWQPRRYCNLFYSVLTR